MKCTCCRDIFIQESGYKFVITYERQQRRECMDQIIIAFAAALAIGLPAIATGWAQSKIGAAGAGSLAEKPELSGTIIILLAIPETMVILGFVVAVIILLGG